MSYKKLHLTIRTNLKKKYAFIRKLPLYEIYTCNITNKLCMSQVPLLNVINLHHYWIKLLIIV